MPLGEDRTAAGAEQLVLRDSQRYSLVAVRLAMALCRVRTVKGRFGNPLRLRWRLLGLPLADVPLDLAEHGLVFALVEVLEDRPDVSVV